MNEYRIEKAPHPVLVTLFGGERIPGAMFVQAYARRHYGREDAADILNEPLDVHTQHIFSKKLYLLENDLSETDLRRIAEESERARSHAEESARLAGTDQRGFARPFDYPGVAASNGGDSSDIGAFEVNEAFAVQVLAFLEHFGIADDDPRVNPYGGAIAMGHPLASSGVRLMNQLARTFEEHPEVRYGMTTMCVGIGMGGTVIWENPHWTGASAGEGAAGDRDHRAAPRRSRLRGRRPAARGGHRSAGDPHGSERDGRRRHGCEGGHQDHRQQDLWGHPAVWSQAAHV